LNLFEAVLKEKEEYLFNFGELVEREKEFLNTEQFERLISSNNFDEFCKSLNDTYYNRYVDEIRKNKDFSFVLEKENLLSMNYLEKNLTENDKKVINFILLDRDIHNIKVVVKSSIMNKDLKHLFLHSAYTYEVLKDFYENGKMDNIEGNIKDILSFVYELKPDRNNLRFVELKLERFFFEKLFDYIKDVKSDFLLKIFRHRVDMLNIKNIYRVKIAGMNIKFKDFIYPEGFLSFEFFEKFENENLDIFASELENSEYIRMIMEGTFLAFSEKTFTSFEKNEEKFVLESFAITREFLSTLERILYFFIRKRFETRSLNIIYTGIVNNIPKEKIKNRIPQL